MLTITPADVDDVALFAGLDEPSLAVVAGWMEAEEVPVGWQLTHQGTSGYAFYVLGEGSADVVIDGVVVRTMGAGDFFGELSILDDGRQTATVTVTSPSVVWTMFGTRFRELQLHHPEIAATIERTAQERRLTR